MLCRTVLLASLSLGCAAPVHSTASRRSPPSSGPGCTEQACLPLCAKGDCAACAEVMPGMKSPSPPDSRASVEAVASACDEGCSSLCATAGLAYAGLAEPPIAGITQDRPRALALFRSGCQAGSAPACNLAWTSGTREVPVGTAEALLRGCEEGSPNACGNLGTMYVKADGVPRDERRGAALLQRGCDGGDVHSCATLGLAVLDGRGVASDPMRAAALLRRACDAHDAPSCGHLGALYANGVGAPKDLAKAEQLMRAGCDGGDRGSCRNLALMPASTNKRRK